MSYQYPEVGAFLKGDATSFTVGAPERKSIELEVGTDRIAMDRDARGYWHAKAKGVTAGSRYKFRIDNGKSLSDPASISQPEGVHGASQVVDRNFAWTDLSWKGIPLSEMIIYELHVGTFTKKGTFESIISKLGYLKDLGVNAIELMPVAQFPGTRNWGYDGVYPFAVQNSYGGVNGLKQLVDAAHKAGIAVILDVVYNHLGPEGNYFSSFGPYFTDKYKTFWGLAINFDDAWCDGVRSYYWQNALMWLNDFHLDGLRLDAVHAIWDFSARHFLEELRTKVTALEAQSGRTKVLIAELDLNNPRFINPMAKGGYGLDGQWIDEFHHALHAVITKDMSGYYEDFGKVGDLAKSFNDSYVYTGQYSIHRKKNFGVLPADNPYSQFVVFSQNHDQVGNRLLGDRLTTKLSFEALKLAAATYLLSPHVPMLFMGEEYGEKNPFQYFISHSDKVIVEAVRKGRKEEFAYFNWQGEVPDPQSEATFNQCLLSWANDKDPTSALLLEYYKFLISFRTERKAMLARERNALIVLPSSDENVLLFERKSGQNQLLIALNFNKVQASIINPNKTLLKKIFDSASAAWGGLGEVTSSEIKPEAAFHLNGESAVVFEF
jgi:maltooligosyltrehalose trehalohydrolase